MLKQPDWFATSAAGLRLAGEEMIADSGEAHGRQHPAGIHVESLEGTGRVLRDRSVTPTQARERLTRLMREHWCREHSRRGAA